MKALSGIGFSMMFSCSSLVCKIRGASRYVMEEGNKHKKKGIKINNVWFVVGVNKWHCKINIAFLIFLLNFFVTDNFHGLLFLVITLVAD